MNSESAAAAIAVLRDAYPRAEFPERSAALYGRMLAHLDGDELTAAVRRLILRSTFLPSISEIVNEVAEARLELPSAAEAWEILERGSLKEAAVEIQAAARAVGGRWGFRASDNPSAVRAQFKRDYEERRARALAMAGGYAIPHAIPPAVEAAAVVDALPESKHISPRPVMARLLRRIGGLRVEPPSESECRDAIVVLREGGDVETDQLYHEAERIFEEASRG